MRHHSRTLLLGVEVVFLLLCGCKSQEEPVKVGLQLSIAPTPAHGTIEILEWSPNGNHLATVGSDQTISIWDVSTGMPTQTFIGHAPVQFPRVNAISWSPDSQRIASAGNDNTVRIWQVDNGKQQYLWRGKNWVRCVAWCSDGTKIAFGGEDKIVTVLNADNYALITEFHGHQHTLGVLAVAWSPSGDRLASSAVEDDIRIWNATNGHQILSIKGHGGIPDEPSSRRWPRVYSLAWSPSNELLASGANDWTARVWDTRDGKLTATFGEHKGSLSSVDWSPIGSLISSEAREGVSQIGKPPSDTSIVRIWNSLTGKQEFKLKGRLAAWSPSGKTIAYVADDNCIRIWNLEMTN